MVFPLDFPGKIFNEITSYALYEVFLYNGHPRESVMNSYLDVHHRFKIPCFTRFLNLALYPYIYVSLLPME